MASLGAQFDLAKLIAEHNDEGDDFRFDLHTIICIRSQWQGGVTFTELSMPQLMFNLGRAIQSEWELQIQSDGSFAFCSAEIGVIVFGVNSLGSVSKQVSWSTGIAWQKQSFRDFFPITYYVNSTATLRTKTWLHCTVR